MSLGNNASPKEKIGKFTNSVQNIPLALAAQSSQIFTVGLTHFRALPPANLLYLQIFVYLFIYFAFQTAL